MQQWEPRRKPASRDGGIISGQSSGDGSKREDGRDKGEDDTGAEAGNEVAEVAAGAPVRAPVVGGVEVAPSAQATLLDFVRPIGDEIEEGKERGFGGMGAENANRGGGGGTGREVRCEWAFWSEGGGERELGRH